MPMQPSPISETCGPVLPSFRCFIAIPPYASLSSVKLRSMRLGWLLQHERERRKPDKDEHQQEEHVGEGQHHALDVDHLVELLQRHRLGVAAVVMEAPGEFVKRLDCRWPSEGDGLV